MIFASLGAFVYLLFAGEASRDLVLLSITDWFYIALLAVVATAFAFVVSVEVMKEISPFTVAISINLEPIYAIILALFIFGEEEKMTPQFYVGAIIIVAAIFVDAYLKRRSNRKKVRSNSV